MREDLWVMTERLVAKAVGENVKIIGATDLGDDWAPVRRLSLDVDLDTLLHLRIEDRDRHLDSCCVCNPAPQGFPHHLFAEDALSGGKANG